MFHIAGFAARMPWNGKQARLESCNEEDQQRSCRQRGPPALTPQRTKTDYFFLPFNRWRSCSSCLSGSPRYGPRSAGRGEPPARRFASSMACCAR